MSILAALLAIFGLGGGGVNNIPPMPRNDFAVAQEAPALPGCFSAGREKEGDDGIEKNAPLLCRDDCSKCKTYGECTTTVCPRRRRRGARRETPAPAPIPETQNTIAQTSLSMNRNCKTVTYRCCLEKECSRPQNCGACGASCSSTADCAQNLLCLSNAQGGKTCRARPKENCIDRDGDCVCDAKPGEIEKRLFVKNSDGLLYKTNKCLPGKEYYIGIDINGGSDISYKEDKINILYIVDKSGSMLYDWGANYANKRPRGNARIVILLDALQKSLWSNNLDFPDLGMIDIGLFAFYQSAETNSFVPIFEFENNGLRIANAVGDVLYSIAGGGKIESVKGKELVNVDFNSKTPLYEALDLGIDELSKREGKRILVLFSDGGNHQTANLAYPQERDRSGETQRRLKEKARAGGVKIIAVAVGSPTSAPVCKGGVCYDTYGGEDFDLIADKVISAQGTGSEFKNLFGTTELVKFANLKVDIEDKINLELFSNLALEGVFYGGEDREHQLSFNSESGRLTGSLGVIPFGRTARILLKGNTPNCMDKKRVYLLDDSSEVNLVKYFIPGSTSVYQESKIKNAACSPEGKVASCFMKIKIGEWRNKQNKICAQ